MPTDFAETSEQEIADIVAINVTGTLRITHIILPIMIKQSVRSLFPVFPFFHPFFIENAA